MFIAPQSNRRGRTVFGKPTAFVIPTGTFSGVSIFFLIFIYLFYLFFCSFIFFILRVIILCIVTHNMKEEDVLLQVLVGIPRLSLICRFCRFTVT